MTGESNLHAHYSFREYFIDGYYLYTFFTDHHKKYTLYFLDGSGYFERYPDIKSDVVVFGFKCQDFDTGSFIRKHDPRIKATIFEILLTSVIRYPDRVVMVMFEHNGLARNRRVAFAQWYDDFKRWCPVPISKSQIVLPAEGYPSSCFVIFTPGTSRHFPTITHALIDFKDELISKGVPPDIELFFDQ